MKHFFRLLMIGALLCAIWFCLPHRQAPPTAEEIPTPTELPAEQKAETSFDRSIVLHVLHDGNVTEMTLRDYLTGVVLAEMPTSYPQEALNAQAIAARTFALRKVETSKHPNADICTDSSCCQGWLDAPGTEEYTRAQTAVDTTDGLVVTYQNSLIDATFFSCSDGKTESAAAVWGSDIAYLQSVDSPGEEDAPHYRDSVCVDADSFAEVLQSTYPDVNLSGSPEGWFGAQNLTAGGGIDTVFIGGIPVRGTVLRNLFSLRSTDIRISASQSEILLETRGFGHRVGMSQYGAKVMAENGSTFSEILTHYYTGTEIKKLLCPKEDRAVFSLNQPAV